MDKLLQVEKQYQVEGDFFGFLKRIPGLLKMVLGEVGLLVGSIGGFIIGSMVILTGLFTLFAVGAFINYGIGYFF